MAAIVLIAAFDSDPARATDGLVIKKAALIKLYRERCEINLNLIRERLRRTTVKIKDTPEPAAGSVDLSCGGANDPSFAARIQNDRYLEEAEAYIRKNGASKFILAARQDMEQTLRKYKYEESLRYIEANDATASDLKILSLIIGSIAASEALIGVAEKSSRQ